MNCMQCSRENDDRRRYCGDCGSSLRQVCGGCAFANEARDHYCGGCGAELVAAAHAPRAARPMARPIAPAPIAPAPLPAPVAVAPAPEPRPQEPAEPAVSSKTPRISQEIEVVDAAEIAQLLEDADEPENEVALPQGRVTQDDLDRLFGDGF